MLLFDQNLSAALPRRLVDDFPACAHVRDCGMAESTDADVIAFAARLGYAVVTKDRDFAILAGTTQSTVKVIWLRLGNCPTRLVIETLMTHRDEIVAFLADGARSVLEIGLRSNHA
ncbi:MAG: DUF5615 family PIN-like protein [Dehalococcoidia bacterium]